MESEKQSILAMLATFESELQAQDIGGELTCVEYYNKFNINGINFERGVFIVTIQERTGNERYELYVIDSSHKVLSIDSEGNEIIYSEELEDFIGDQIKIEDIRDAEQKQKEDLKGMSEKMEEEKSTQEEEKAELGITYYREIQDHNLENQMKIKFSEGVEEKGMAYSEKFGGFVLVEKINGKLQQVEGTQVAKPTMKTVISLDENGERTEEKVPHALMKTDDPTKELSITKEGGYIETGTVEVLPCSMRVEMQLRESGEGLDAQRNKELEDLTNKEGKEAIHEIAHEHKKVKELIEEQTEQFTDEEIEFFQELAKDEGISLDRKSVV